MCSREPSIRVKLSHVYLPKISLFPDIHRNLERNRLFEVLFLLNQRFPYTRSASAFSNTNVELSLCFLWSLSSGAFRDGSLDWWWVWPLLFLKKKEKKPNKQKNPVVAEVATQQHRKIPSKVYSAGRAVNVQQVLCQEKNAAEPPGFYSILCQPFCTSTQQFLLLTMAVFYGHPLSMQMPLICLCLSV